MSQFVPNQSIVSLREVRKSRALVSGADGIRDKGQTYLTKQFKEDTDGYQRRLNNTYLLPFFERTVDDMTSRVFGAPITFPENLSSFWETWLESSDDRGRRFVQIARDAFHDALLTGVTFAVPEAPARMDGETAADGVEFQTRVDLYYADQVNDYSLIPGTNRLAYFQVHIGDKERRSWSLQEGGVYRRTEIVAQGSWIVQSEGFYPPEITELPVFILAAGQTDVMRFTPPLRMIADLNLAHYNSESDYREGLRFRQRSLLVVSGASVKDVDISHGSLMALPDASAKAIYAEPTGPGAKDARQAILDIEENAEKLGLQFATQRIYGETATGQEINRRREVTRLLLIADNFQIQLNKLLTTVGILVNQEWPEEGLVLNSDVDNPLDANAQNTLFLQMQAAGILGNEDVILLMKENRTLSENFVPTEPSAEGSGIMNAGDRDDVPVEPGQ